MKLKDLRNEKYLNLQKLGMRIMYFSMIHFVFYAAYKFSPIYLFKLKYNEILLCILKKHKGFFISFHAKFLIIYFPMAWTVLSNSSYI